jgi:hypothetical protein
LIKQYYTTPRIRTVVIRIGLALRLYFSRILRNYFALKLPVIGSSTVECYGFLNVKSGVVERCILYFLFSWRYNPLLLYFHSPVSGFSLLVFEVS